VPRRFARPAQTGGSAPRTNSDRTLVLTPAACAPSARCVSCAYTDAIV
jgi:hypothetical protein